MITAFLLFMGLWLLIDPAGWVRTMDKIDGKKR